MKAWLRVFDQHGENMLPSARCYEARRQLDGHYVFRLSRVYLHADSAPEASGYMLIQKKTNRIIHKALFAPSRPVNRVGDTSTIYLGTCVVRPEIYAKTPASP